jgi:hypothetical protein
MIRRVSKPRREYFDPAPPRWKRFVCMVAGHDVGLYYRGKERGYKAVCLRCGKDGK